MPIDSQEMTSYIQEISTVSREICIYIKEITTYFKETSAVRREMSIYSQEI